MPFERRRFIALAAGALAGCSSTRIDSVWRGPQAPAVPPGATVLVVGVSRDEALRRLFEDALVADLARRSVRGVASYTLARGPLQDTSGTQLVAAARGAGAALVLSSAIVNGQLLDNLGVPGPGSSFAAAYTAHWQHVYGPNVLVDRRFVARTTLSDTADETVVWALSTSTRNLGSVEVEVRDMAGAIVDALREERLAAPRDGRGQWTCEASPSSSVARRRRGVVEREGEA